MRMKLIAAAAAFATFPALAQTPPRMPSPDEAAAAHRGPSADELAARYAAKAVGQNQQSDNSSLLQATTDALSESVGRELKLREALIETRKQLAVVQKDSAEQHKRADDAEAKLSKDDAKPN